jgi:hypothetical protein
MMLTEETEVLREKKNCLKASLSIINSEGTDVGSNLIFRGNKYEPYPCAVTQYSFNN